jgi:hypothetical protein
VCEAGDGTVELVEGTHSTSGIAPGSGSQAGHPGRKGGRIWCTWAERKASMRCAAPPPSPAAACASQETQTQAA